jgi:predicted RNase H-like HicB family nuclease
MRIMEYAVVFEKSRTGWGAYAPDLPGCGATGRTLPMTRKRIREAIALHLQGMREDGARIPRPTTQVERVTPKSVEVVR